MNKILILYTLGTLFISTGCSNDDSAKKRTASPKPVINRKAPAATVSYSKLVRPKRWADSINKRDWPVLMAVNRADSAGIIKMDSLIIPSDLSGDIAYYMPFPFSVPYLRDIKKIIFFSYPAQSFGAYEYGELVYAGPTNMGRKADPTPTGLFFSNWKAKETTSTFNDEWELKWNFNIENQKGVGWHQYAMPGYPASHSCLRLLEKDARYLYDWADEWKLHGKDSIAVKGTPVIVFGNYPFDGEKPWWQLPANPHALDINEKQLEELVKPYLNEIMKEQDKKNNAPAQ